MEELSQGSDAANNLAVPTDAASESYVGRWRRLVSTTNWEKGQIIAQWRDALLAAGATPVEFSDDAWSKRVGGVTGQHVGRLRRVHQRFGNVYEKYPGLYWSHFHSSVDWTDAEMWLEGAVQNGWSVSEMRRMRWETLGAVEELRPVDTEITSAELDEDVMDEESPSISRTGSSPLGDSATQRSPDLTSTAETEDVENEASAESAPSIATSDASRIRPFAELPTLPSDLTEAFEAFKLAILRHKSSKWNQVDPDHVLESLDALKCLVTAPSQD